MKASISTSRLFDRSGAAKDLAGHLQRNGPFALPRTDLEVAALIEELRASGLGGRGGGGFPSAQKLARYRELANGALLLAVNATEGEPESQKDRTLCIEAPHLVLDGAQLAAHVARARRIALCVDAAQGVQFEAMATALAERGRARGDRVPVELVRVPPGYVTGEESALARFVRSGVAKPFFRPSKATPLEPRRRLPVLVQNAETCAHVALIARHGAAWFTSAGLNGATGTTLVTISGAVERPGVYEVACGAPLREILALSAPRSCQAVLVGGYGGSWIARGNLYRPFSAPGLAPVGARPGAGVLYVLGDDACGIAESLRIAAFLSSSGMGQCGPCRFGLPAIEADLQAIVAASGEELGSRRQALGRLDRHLTSVAGRGACAHPDGVVRMVRSALSVFGEDLEQHLAGRACATGWDARGGR